MVFHETSELLYPIGKYSLYVKELVINISNGVLRDQINSSSVTDSVDLGMILLTSVYSPKSNNQGF